MNYIKIIIVLLILFSYNTVEESRCLTVLAQRREIIHDVILYDRSNDINTNYKFILN